MHVAPDVAGNCVLGPFPVLQRLRVELELARRRGKADAGVAVDLHTDRRPLLVEMTLLAGRPRASFEASPGRAVSWHSVRRFPRSETRRTCACNRSGVRPSFAAAAGKSGNAVLEDPAVVIVDASSFARPVRRLEVFADAQRTVGIDAPGQLDPELVFFPDLAEAGLAMGLIGQVESLALLFQRDAQRPAGESQSSARRASPGSCRSWRSEPWPIGST